MRIEKIELYIIKEQIDKLCTLPYFDSRVEQYLQQLSSSCQDIINKFSHFTPSMCLDLASSLWTSVQYLSGSSKNETPYEIVYCLKRILNSWFPGETGIVTALINEKNYYFYSSDPGHIFKTILGHDFGIEIIQVALPQLYRHFPLYNVVLYHELGHFIDLKYRISRYALLSNPSLKIEAHHLSEYFADIFAASYTGNSVIHFLNNAIPPQPESQSHPSTTSRSDAVKDFLNGNFNTIVSILKDTTNALISKDLTINFSSPKLNNYYDNIRPYPISNENELYGIIDAAWTYTIERISGQQDWQHVHEYESFKIINDITEKSIRNFIISTKWNLTDAPPQ